MPSAPRGAPRFRRSVSWAEIPLAAGIAALAYFCLLLAWAWQDADRHAQLLHPSLTDGNPGINGRAQDVLRSAASMQNNGMYLTLLSPDGTKVGPIENAVVGDFGHALLAQLMAKFRKSPLTLVSLVRLNYVITAAGLAILAWMLLSMGLTWSAGSCLVLGAYFGMPGPVPSADISGAYLGATALCCVPVVWLLGISSLEDIPKTPKHLAQAAVSWFCLVGSYLLRQPIGATGAIACMLAIAALWWRHRKAGAPAWIAAAALCLGVIAATKVPNLMAWIRDRAYGFPPSSLPHSHGLWHTMFLGLGAVDNRWGIVWSDRYAFERFLKLHPGIRLLSPAYFDTMRHDFLALVREAPGEVIRIYWQKLRMSLSLPGLGVAGVNAFILSIACGLVGAWLLRTKPEIWRPAILASFTGVLICFAMLLQGVLAKPSIEYLHPVPFLAAWSLATLIEGLSPPASMGPTGKRRKP